jgi:hypothetical protein
MELHGSEPARDALGTRVCIQIYGICKYFKALLGPLQRIFSGAPEFYSLVLRCDIQQHRAQLLLINILIIHIPLLQPLDI